MLAWVFLCLDIVRTCHLSQEGTIQGNRINHFKWAEIEDWFTLPLTAKYFHNKHRRFKYLGIYCGLLQEGSLLLWYDYPRRKMTYLEFVPIGCTFGKLIVGNRISLFGSYICDWLKNCFKSDIALESWLTALSASKSEPQEILLRANAKHGQLLSVQLKGHLSQRWLISSDPLGLQIRQSSSHRGLEKSLGSWGSQVHPRHFAACVHFVAQSEKQVPFLSKEQWHFFSYLQVKDLVINQISIEY